MALSLNLSPSFFTTLHNKNDHTMELKHYQPTKGINLTKNIESNKSEILELWNKLKFEEKERTSYTSNMSVNSELDNDGAIVRVKSHAG